MGTCFFIVGSGRCGSTALYLLLKDHECVALTNEARVLDGLGLAFEALTLPYGTASRTRTLEGIVGADCVHDLGAVFQEHAWQILRKFYEVHFPRPFTHWGDKLPDPFCTAQLCREHPEVRVIILARDPRDVVCSYESLKRRAPAELGPLAQRMLSAAPLDHARTWLRTHDCLLEGVPDPLIVLYPDLMIDRKGVATRVLEYLDLPWSAAIDDALRAELWLEDHATTDSAADSLCRWRDELEPGLAQEVLDICGPMMTRLGLES